MGRLGAADVAERLGMQNLAATVRELDRVTGAAASGLDGWMVGWLDGWMVG